MRTYTTELARGLYILVLFLIVPAFIQAQIVVNSTSDADIANDGICTLREAIIAANTDLPSGIVAGECAAGSAADTIQFNIGGGGSPQTIQPTFGLPSITEAVLIDGPSQGCPSGPCIELDGSIPVVKITGLTITSSGSTIRGLAINRFLSGVLISGGGATNNTVEGSYLGINLDGDAAAANNVGVAITGGATNNLIGGNNQASRNVISGNLLSGVDIFGAGVAANSVRGNYIGTNARGSVAIGNKTGVTIRIDAANNMIGGTAAGAGNLISGNSRSGISLSNSGSSGNKIEGNLIGTDKTGTFAIANREGIFFSQGANDNVIGGTTDAARNVISGNTGEGIHLQGVGTDSNRVEGNYIGTDITGAVALANGGNGVEITQQASGNSIGGTAAGSGNVISGNVFSAIQLWSAGTSGNTIQRNLIGTNAIGTGALPNFEGIRIWEAADSNAVGGTTRGAGNTIAFNTHDGVVLGTNAGNWNSILSNSIFSNGDQGIDVGFDGVTPNDGTDVDAGPNNFQNFPDLKAAVLVESNLILIYLVDTDTMYADYPLRIEFFEADSDAEEGQRFLGFDKYSTFEWHGCGTPPCLDSLTIDVSGTLAAGDTLVATATDSLGNTSEFSPSIIVKEGGPSGISLYAKAFLEGPYNAANDNMTTDLFDSAVLPMSQPFSDPVFNSTVLDFDSVQTVSSHADSTVDWLLVSLRTGTTPGTEVAGTEHAAVIFKGGTVANPDDDSLRFAGVGDGSYYLVLRSRNHLDIMSSAAVVVSAGVGSWDFTTAITQTFGANAQKELETGVWGMFAGDGTVDGQVTASDFNDWLVDTKAVATGFLQTDFDLDAQVTASDFNLWLVNTKAVVTSKVP